MDIQVTFSIVLIGLAAVAAGGFGLTLPAGERISAVLPLVVGAGVGVVALAIGSQIAGDSNEDYQRVFLIASALGFVGTLASLVVLSRTTKR